MAVATFGSEGSLAYDGEQFYQFGIFPATVENTVGAGDAFIAGFMAGFYWRSDPESALKTEPESQRRSWRYLSHG